MKLVHPYYFREIDFENEEPHTLVVERGSFFRQIITELLYESENGIGDYVLSENNEILNFAKCCSIIMNPFMLDFQNKQIKSGLQKQAVELLNTENETADIICQINQLGLRVANQFGLPVTIKQDIGVSDLVKLLDFKIDTGDLSFTEQIIEFCKLSRDLSETKLFIIINIKDYMDPDEFMLTMDMFRNEKINLLMLENRQHPLMDDLQNTIIVDSDYCII